MGASEECKPFSALYSLLVGLDTPKVSQLLSAWQSDIPALADDDWEDGIQQYISLMISSREKFTQVTFLHRVYYSPERLSRIYPNRRPACHRCNTEEGSFFHVVWSCPQLQIFWRGVVDILNFIGKLRIPCDPIPLLLGICDTLEAPKLKDYLYFMQPSMIEKQFCCNGTSPSPRWSISANTCGCGTAPIKVDIYGM